MAATAHYDLIVIGGGSAGLTAVTMAAKLGARALLVDRESLGGDCLHYGCVPSKSLIASARTAHTMRHAGRFGLDPVSPEVDFGRIMDRVDAIRDDIGTHESPEAIRGIGVDVELGGARFLDDTTVEVGGSRRVTSGRFIVATGSRAVAPDIPGLAEAGFIDHVGLFRLRQRPGRLAVIGGGPIGAEMGQAMSRLGSEVTIIQRGPRILAREEPETSKIVQAAFEEEGITLMLSANPVRVSTDGGEKLVDVQQQGKTRAVHCDEILVAAGRRPVLEDLNLQSAGVETNRRGIVVDEQLRTNKPHIFAVGDCNGGPQFTHWAEYEARIATRNALYRGSSRRRLDIVPRVTFTDPEVASVGVTHANARESHGDHRIHVHEFPYSRLDRAVCESATTGMIRVVVGDHDRLLGAHIVGKAAGEALTEWVLAIEHKLPLKKVGSAIHAYPTLSRINRRVADEAFLTHGVSPWTNRLFARFKPASGA